MRYTIDYTLASPKQATPPDDATVTEWVVKPSQSGFSFQTQYSGAFVQPDKFDYELSSAPDQPSTRGIRIGKAQWYLLNKTWVPDTQPVTNFLFTPAVFCDVLVSPLDFAGKTGTPEKVGDTETTHFRIDAAPISAAAKLFGDGSDNGKLLQAWDVDLWLTNKNRLVKVEAAAKANYPYGREMSSKLTLEVGSFNDGDIPDIKPPVLQ